jgi:hypothetical protein
VGSFGYSNQPKSILRYGITLSDYYAMRDAQNGCCAICEREEGVMGGLIIEHDHDSNRVRGLTCRRCNAGLWRFDDNPYMLRAAADYLEERGWWGNNPMTPEEEERLEQWRRDGIVAKHRYREERALHRSEH